MGNRPSPEKQVIRFFLVSIIVFVLSLITHKLTIAPAFPQESALQDQLSSADVQVFDALRRLDLANHDKIISIDSDDNKVSDLRNKAQQIWDSISVGGVIYKKGVGGDRPAGKNSEVEELRKNADLLEKSVRDKKREISRLEGNKLENTVSASLWHEHQSLLHQIENLHEIHAWYYKGRWGSLLSIIHDLSRLLFLVSSFFSIILLVPALTSLKGPRKKLTNNKQ